jgi:hypothetical protein
MLTDYFIKIIVVMRNRTIEITGRLKCFEVKAMVCCKDRLSDACRQVHLEQTWQSWIGYQFAVIAKCSMPPKSHKAGINRTVELVNVDHLEGGRRSILVTNFERDLESVSEFE